MVKGLLPTRLRVILPDIKGDSKFVTVAYNRFYKWWLLGVGMKRKLVKLLLIITTGSTIQTLAWLVSRTMSVPHVQQPLSAQ